MTKKTDILPLLVFFFFAIHVIFLFTISTIFSFALDWVVYSALLLILYVFWSNAVAWMVKDGTHALVFSSAIFLGLYAFFYWGYLKVSSRIELMNKLYDEGVTFRKSNILLLNPTGVTDKDIWVFWIVVITLGIVLVYSSKQLNQRRVER